MARCSSKVWGSARMAAIATSSTRAAAICFSAAKCCLSSWLYCVHHGLGQRLFGEGVGPLGGRCRADGRGMLDVEGGGWCSGVDYLPGSTRPSSVKEGHRRGG